MLLPSFALQATPPFAVELFLVGSNPEPLKGFDWLRPEEAANDSPIRAALRAQLAPLMATKRAFVIIDGGDGSPFAGPKPWGAGPEAWSTVDYCSRRYSGYDSKTETRGGKTRVVEHTEVEETQSGGVTVGANAPTARYTAQSYLHFGTDEGHPAVAMMDLNSYLTALTGSQAQDKEHLRKALYFSSDSTLETERFLRKANIDPPGPILCRNGIPRARDRQITAFPPTGVVGRYRLVQDGPGWRLEFVRFYRAAS